MTRQQEANELLAEYQASKGRNMNPDPGPCGFGDALIDNTTGAYPMNQVAKIEGPVSTPPALTEGAAVLSMIERAARDPSVDINKLQQLMDMRERMAARTAEADFDKALTAAQSEMGRVRTDSNNPQTKSRYASYGALDTALRPVYTQHGFALSFNTESPAPEIVRVVCRVSHQNGHSRSYQIDMPADGKGAKGGDVMTKTHATGSAVSYGMRYLLKMIFNIAVSDRDDDGNAAGSGEKISLAQVQELLALCEEVGADKEAFCRYFRVDGFPSIPAKDFDRAKAALNKKRSAK
jgi:hypothetical protein